MSESDEFEFFEGSDIENQLDESGSESEGEEWSSSDTSSSESGNDLLAVRDWCGLTPASPPPPPFPFTPIPRINFEIDEEKDLLQFFEHFVDEGLINLITRETNLYANQTLGAVRNTWKPITNNEMRVFLA